MMTTLHSKHDTTENRQFGDGYGHGEGGGKDRGRIPGSFRSMEEGPWRQGRAAGELRAAEFASAGTRPGGWSFGSGGKTTVSYTKGAPDEVLKRCTRIHLRKLLQSKLLHEMADKSLSRGILISFFIPAT